MIQTQGAKRIFRSPRALLDLDIRKRSSGATPRRIDSISILRTGEPFMYNRQTLSQPREDPIKTFPAGRTEDSVVLYEVVDAQPQTPGNECACSIDRRLDSGVALRPQIDLT